MVETKRKNTDYSQSAVMLTNPPQVMDLLTKYHRLGNEIEKIQLEIDDCIPRALVEKRDAIQQELSETNKTLRQAIDEFGSYQNLDYGEYAVKQKRESITYQAVLTKKVLEPKLAGLVIVESVDGKALDGLVKGGLVTALQARECGEVKETFAYIIK